MTNNLLSAKRQALCSRSHADLIAQRLCENTASPHAVIRTSEALQPYRVLRSEETQDNDAIELEVIAL